MKLVITSCMDAERVPDQSVWTSVAECKPDVLLLLGDQIYMDWGVLGRNWRRITDHGNEGLQAFAENMHQRYARQWRVATFQQLITGLRQRDPAHLLLVWDDHDFTWNNSWGGTPDAGAPQGSEGSWNDPHHVPDEVKRISHALFRQFEAMLRKAHAGDAYPTLPPLGDLLNNPGQALDWHGQLGGTGGPECFLLDTRWNRQGRWPNGHKVGLLADTTRTALLTAAAQPQGLLVAAGGTPMWHKGLLSHDAWCSEAEAGHANGSLPAYREYAELLAAAQRPVLYLAGDVHRNLFTGRLRHPGQAGVPSQVLQLLASGAAIGRLGPKRFWPCFAELDVPTDTMSGTVRGSLCRLLSTGLERRALSELTFDSSGWTHDWAGTAADTPDDDTLDTQQLHLLLARKLRKRVWKNTQTHSVPFTECDELFEEEALEKNASAQPFTLQAQNQAGDEAQVRVTRRANGNPAPEMARQMEEQFATARKRGGAAVFFVHGFGKSLPDAAAQGYRLRELYGASPLVFVWAAGRSGKLLKTVTGAATAINSAETGDFALSAALSQFNELAKAYPDVTSVVLARSAGALALAHALWCDGVNATNQLNHVDRIVLSAPLLSSRNWKDKQIFPDLLCPVVVTRNRNDETLKLASWVDGEKDIMGLDAKFKPNKPGDCCLDFTHAAGVFDLHDYLLNQTGLRQVEVNRALLKQKTFDPNTLTGALSADTGGNQVWNVA